MEKSKNYNFNLPNSANDEIADINDISDNFRIIDEIMNETDQTFEPTSTKAASGKAVNEAISGIQPIDENTEFVFDGGDADGGISVDIVVDTVLSKTSNNPIANKPVAIKFGEILVAIEQAKKDILLSAYPVGSIYISTVSTSPSALFGGTWERIKGRFLLAAGENEANTTTDFGSMSAGELNRPAGELGGEPKHTDTADEMPSHEHAIRSDDGAKSYLCCTSGSGGTDGPGYSFNDSQADQDQNISGAFYATATGGGQPHNNMPPYLAVYVWKRTA